MELHQRTQWVLTQEKTGGRERRGTGRGLRGTCFLPTQTSVWPRHSFIVFGLGRDRVSFTTQTRLALNMPVCWDYRRVPHAWHN